jgi:hypothetical protein
VSQPAAPQLDLDDPDADLPDSPLDPDSPVRRWLRGLEVDLRSLAAFRIALGACVTMDLILRIPQIEVFYTDKGVEPRDLLVRHLGDSSVLTLHMMSGQWIIELLLFLTALVFALGFLVGYRTRLCAFVSLFLLTSLQMRNNLVLHGGDVLMRVLLFWSMFAPVNGRWSLDRALNPEARQLPVTNLSTASIALVFQVCVVYWMAAADKMHPVWITERSAVYYALSLDNLATHFGQSLLKYPETLRWVSVGTVAFEFFGPILALSPFLTGPTRLLVALSFIGFHAGLGMTIHLALFPWTCASAWLAFLPGMFWNSIEHLRARTGWAAWQWSPPAALARWPRLRPPPPRDRLPILAQLFVVACLAFIFWGLNYKRGLVPGSKPERITWRLASITTLGQRWTLFSPYPSRDDGWFIMRGKKRDGSLVDVWDWGRAPSDAKPDDVFAQFRNTQWVKYFSYFKFNADSVDRRPFGRYLCRKWNEQHDSSNQVTSVAVDYMLVWTPPPGRPDPPPKRMPMLTQECADAPRGN